MSTSTSIPSVILDIQLLTPSATLPTRGSEFSAGLDLYSAESRTIPSRGQALIDLQISVSIPEGHYGRIAPRSGLAVKHGISTGAGVIDSDYRGPVKVLLFNHSETDFEVKTKDRIAQLILERISIPQVRAVEKLDDTVRGIGGFGSTGGFGPAEKKQKLENGDSVATAIPVEAEGKTSS